MKRKWVCKACDDTECEYVLDHRRARDFVAYFCPLNGVRDGEGSIYNSAIDSGSGSDWQERQPHDS